MHGDASMHQLHGKVSKFANHIDRIFSITVTRYDRHAGESHHGDPLPLVMQCIIMSCISGR